MQRQREILWLLAGIRSCEYCMEERMPKYSIEIPLDASAIEDFKPEAPVKVLVQTADGTQSKTVELSAKGQGSAGFTFDDVPKGLRILVGPHDATDEEMLGLQTLSVDVSSRLLTKRE